MIESELEGLRRRLSEIRSSKTTRRRYPKELRDAVQVSIRGTMVLGVLSLSTPRGYRAEGLELEQLLCFLELPVLRWTRKALASYEDRRS